MNKAVKATFLFSAIAVMSAAIILTGSGISNAAQKQEPNREPVSSYAPVPETNNASAAHNLALENEQPLFENTSEQQPQNSAEQEQQPQEEQRPETASMSDVQAFLDRHNALDWYDADTQNGHDVFYFALPFLEEYQQDGIAHYGANIQKVTAFAREYFGRELTLGEIAASDEVAEVGEEYFDLVGRCYDRINWQVQTVSDLGDGLYQAGCIVVIAGSGDQQVCEGLATLRKDASSPYGFTLVSSELIGENFAR